MPYLRSRFGPPPSVVAARIKAERERLGITQEAAAAALEINRGSYKQLEITANPQLATLIALKDVLGFDLARIAPELFAPGLAQTPPRVDTTVGVTPPSTTPEGHMATKGKAATKGKTATRPKSRSGTKAATARAPDAGAAAPAATTTRAKPKAKAAAKGKAKSGTSGRAGRGSG